MKILALIAAGGAVGALLRFWMTGATHGLLGTDFPYGTLLVNLCGSTAIGFANFWLIHRFGAGIDTELRAFIIIGVLGAFTTFSAFSLEMLILLENGALARATAYVVTSVTVCVTGAWLGMLLARHV